MQFGILGPIEVTELGRTLPIGGPKQRALLALLAVNAGRLVPASRMIAELWADSAPGHHDNALQARISQLRRVVGVDRVLFRSSGYVLDVDVNDVDAARFERLVVEGRRLLVHGFVHEAAATLAEALVLWRGPALDLDAPFARIESARLEEMRITAIEDRAEADLALGRHLGLVHELQSLVSEYPLREGLCQRLILALYRSGRQSEALRAYQETRRQLGRLGLHPGPELRALEGRVLAQDPGLEVGSRAPQAVAPEPVPAGNIRRSLSSFVGRNDDLVKVPELLAAHRLVTLIGAGGSGKTRLALEVGSRLQASVADGVWVVQMESLSDPLSVRRAVCSALGLSAGSGTGDRPGLDDRLIEFLRPKKLVVILDNCDHVVEAAANLSEDMLGHCENVWVLATSRQPLPVVGGIQWRVPSLSVPDREVRSPEALASYESVQLFIERASAVEHTFSLDPTTARAVADVCRRLDGMPLAIELAAARVNALPVADIVSRLDDRFHLLTGSSHTALPRHETLRALIDWSYEVLSDEERMVFEGLAVFADGARLDTAEQVCASRELDGGDVAALVSRLIDKSLLVAEPAAGGAVRYRMLETLREYAREKLAGSGHADDAYRRQALYFVTLTQTAETVAYAASTSQVGWIERLDEELDNIQAVVDWAVNAQDYEIALRISGSMGWYWYLRGHFQEGGARLESVLASAEPHQVSPSVRARVLSWAGFMAHAERDSDTAVRRCEKAITLVSGEDADDRTIAGSHLLLAMVLTRKGDHRRVTFLLQQAAAAFRRSGDEGGIGWVHYARALDTLRRGNLKGAGTVCRQGLPYFEASGNRWGRGRMNFLLGVVAEIQADLAEATCCYEKSLADARALALPEVEAITLAQLGHVAEIGGDRGLAELRFDESTVLLRKLSGVDAAFPGDRRISWRRSDLARASGLRLETLEWARQGRGDESARFSLCCLGFAHEIWADYAEAGRRYVETIGEAGPVADWRALSGALDGLARVAILLGSINEGTVLLGASDSVRESSGITRFRWEMAERRRATDVARSALGEDVYQSVLDNGRAKSRAEAVSLARRWNPSATP